MNAYASPGELICGIPYPFDGKPCQLPPNHWPDYPYHAKPASGGFDTWAPLIQQDIGSPRWSMT